MERRKYFLLVLYNCFPSPVSGFILKLTLMTLIYIRPWHPQKYYYYVFILFPYKSCVTTIKIMGKLYVTRFREMEWMCGPLREREREVVDILLCSCYLWFSCCLVEIPRTCASAVGDFMLHNVVHQWWDFIYISGVGTIHSFGF